MWDWRIRVFLTLSYCSFHCDVAASAKNSQRTGLTSLCMADRRVVVTGMGITSCLGNTLDDVKKSLHEATPGITFQEEFEKLGIKSQVAGVPALTEDDFKELIPKGALRFMGTNAKYAYVALDRAIQDSGLKPEEYEENPRVAAIIGQGGTSIPDIVETVEAVQEGGKRWKNKVGPFRVTRSMGSTCSAVLATNFKVQGPSYSISSACSTGAHCIGTGMEQILLNKCDIAFCGAGKSISCRNTLLTFLLVLLLTFNLSAKSQQVKTSTGNSQVCLTVWVPFRPLTTRTQRLLPGHSTRIVTVS